MEQNNILDKHQVKSIYDSMLIDLDKSVNKLFVDAEDAIVVSSKKWAEDNKVQLEIVYKANLKFIKEHNKYESEVSKLPGFETFCAVVEESTYEKFLADVIALKLERDIASANLTPTLKYRLQTQANRRLNAILHTMSNGSYESIVSEALKKLNINDLFDNRNKYL